MSDYHQTAAQALAKCAAYDPWFPQPNRATVDAWAEQIARYQLGRDDVLEGVAKMYADNASGFRPLPKDLTDAARSIRRDRDALTGPTPEYQALCDSKSEPPAHELEVNRERLAAMIAPVAAAKGIDHA